MWQVVFLKEPPPVVGILQMEDMFTGINLSQVNFLE